MTAQALYLTQDPQAVARKFSVVVPSTSTSHGELQSASLRLRVTGAAILPEAVRARVLKKVDELAMYVEGVFRRAFRAQVAVLLKPAGDKAGAVEKLLKVPSIGTLSEALFYEVDAALGNEGCAVDMCCVEGGMGKTAENGAILLLMLHTHKCEHLRVSAAMTPEVFHSTSIQNWSHLQAIIQRA